MNCCSQVVGCLSYALEQVGLYEPELSEQEAANRLVREGQLWRKCQSDRDKLWLSLQTNQPMGVPLPSLVTRALTHLGCRNIQGSVAVELGCGLSPSVSYLAQKWKVYAVDSSASVIQRIAVEGRNAIEQGRLVLEKQTIEKFEYPERVHLIVAIDSLPYADPEQIGAIFLRAKNALLPEGVFVCSIFPYSGNPFSDFMMRDLFGGWMTTKNVIDALVKSIGFSSCTVTVGTSPNGIAKQFHIFATG